MESYVEGFYISDSSILGPFYWVPLIFGKSHTCLGSPCKVITKPTRVPDAKVPKPALDQGRPVVDHRTDASFYWVASKEPNLDYHFSKTIFLLCFPNMVTDPDPSLGFTTDANSWMQSRLQKVGI